MKIKQYFKKKKYLMHLVLTIAGVVCIPLILAQLLISSTSESALVNPLAVPMAFWLGLLLAEHRNRTKRGT